MNKEQIVLFKYTPIKSRLSPDNTDGTTQRATSIETEEGRDQVTPNYVQNLQNPHEDEFDSESSVNITIKGSEESSALEHEVTLYKTTANDQRKERIKWTASLQEKEWHA
ncbi:hypothetical protein DPMN_180085 [Dreissena polymorpha]|uniref:Uncharacterized protein n=1 Tax=Dreissena polymorpha TaxID=45954 RepID=A0A9D4EHF7_DREPO|nr:hypothetical protein DPMN_180085 [Dreissena polymorpha]